MRSSHAGEARRNAYVFAATALGLGLLALYPTSTNSGASQRNRSLSTRAAPAGIVAAPAPAGTAAPIAPNPSSTKRSSPKAATSAAPAMVVVNGSSADTQYGPVQVQLKILSRRILSATAINYPQDNQTSQSINRQAIPLLQQETVLAQNAHIDTISGATYTSGGYLQSVQAALDAAHL